MTVPSQTPKVTHTANGTSKSFAFTFRIRKTSHLAVYVDSTLQTLGTHYSVTSTNLAAGGSVVFVNAPANGAKVRIYRNMPYSRTDFDYQTSGSFPAATINEDLDSLALQVQQIADAVSRSVSVGLFSDGVSTALPSPESLKFLRWNNAANALENATYNVESVLASAVHKAEQQTAAEGQTVFNLTNSYLPGTNSLQVEMNNAILASGIDYTETSATSITLVDPAYADDFLVFKTISFVNAPASDAASVAFIQSGVNSVARNVQDKCREILSVVDKGADVSGATDSAGAILKAFDDIRTAGGGVVVFPNRGNATYLISHGFLVPPNCLVILNGAKFRATTTFGQGTLPTNGTFRGAFVVAGSLTNGATLSGYTENIFIEGGGAAIDMRYDEQTGTVPGSMGIVVETTPAPIAANEFKVRNVVVRNVTIEQAPWYGTYTSGPENVFWINVRATNPANLGHVGVSGRSVYYMDCYASGAQERTASQGCGFWNEADSTWQQLTNFHYINCLSEFNKKSGFRWYNDGQDVPLSIYAYNCISRKNNWDGAAFTASTVEHGHDINLTKIGSQPFSIVLDNCAAEDEYNGGIHVHRKTGTGSKRTIVISNPRLVRCNSGNVDSYYRAPIGITGDGNTDINLVVNSPVVIAPSANTVGYGVAADYASAFFLNNPAYIGTFSAKTVINNLPSSRRGSAGFDPAYDDKDTGILGAATAFNKPIRLATFDQTAEPSAANDLYRNELAVWQDDNDQFIGVFRRDDSNSPRYLDFRSRKRLRATASYAGGTINIGDQVGGTVTVTGATLGDIVQVSYNQSLTSCFAFGYVSASDTVTWTISNNSLANRTVAAGTVVINVLPSDY